MTAKQHTEWASGPPQVVNLRAWRRPRQPAQPRPAPTADGDSTDLLALLVRDPTTTMIYIAAGEPMHEAGVYHGDHLITDTALAPSIGDLVVLNRGGAETVWVFTPQDDATAVIGVVLHVIHTLKRMGEVKRTGAQ